MQADRGGSGVRAAQGPFYAGIYTILTDFIYVLLLEYAFIRLGEAPNLNMSLDYFQKQAMF